METEKRTRLSLRSFLRADSQLLKVTLQVKTGWLQDLQGISGPSQADNHEQIALHEKFLLEDDCGGLKTAQARDPTPELNDDA